MSVVKKGSTDVTRYIMLRDSADGTPETAYTIVNLDLQYTRERSTPAVKVDATALAATNSAHGDNQAIEIDSTSSPGLYRVDWPDAAFASGVDKVVLVVSGVGLDPAVEEIELVDYDPEDGVRLGLTALPNAAADAAGGLPISDAGALDLDALNTAAVRLTAARAQAIDDWINGGRLDLLLDAIPTTAMRGTDNAALATTALSNATWTDARAGYLNNINGHTAQTGDSYARLGAPAGASIAADIADVPTVAELNARTLAAAAYGTAANQTTIAGYIDTEVAAILAAVDTEVAAIKAVTDLLPDGGALTAIGTDTARLTAVRAAVLTDWIDGGRLDLLLDAILALLDDVRTEPGQGTPPVNPDLVTKIDYLYKAWRNKATQTATEYDLYDDAGAVIDQKASVSDDGTTFTRGEMGTGP